MLYTKKFNEEEIDDLQLKKELEAKYVRKLIKQLKVDRHSNKEARAEFAKLIFQIALSSDPYARKFIGKLSSFASYWENDEMISEEEWHKLNNTND